MPVHDDTPTRPENPLTRRSLLTHAGPTSAAVVALGSGGMMLATPATAGTGGTTKRLIDAARANPDAFRRFARLDDVPQANPAIPALVAAYHKASMVSGIRSPSPRCTRSLWRQPRSGVG